MYVKQLFNPVSGLPFTVAIYDDGTFSYTHLDGTVMHGKYDFLQDIYCFESDAMNNHQMISASDAVQILNITKQRISQLCESGRLESGFIGNSLFVSLDSVRKYKETDRTPGRK